jgi:hypothetical protein
MNLVGKKIGELTPLSTLTNSTKIPVELSGVTYHVDSSKITELVADNLSGETINGTININGGLNINGSPISVDLSGSTNDIIVLSANTISTKYQTQISDSVVSISVGGAPAQSASIWKTYNMVQVLDTILFPTLNPTYTIPTLSFSSSVTGTREVGTTITPTLTMVGTKNDAGNFTEFVFLRNTSTTLSTVTSLTTGSTTNVADQYGYTNPNSPNRTFTSTFVDSYVIPSPTGGNSSSTSTYGGTSIYLSGSTKQDNKGVFDTRPYAVRSTNAPQLGSATLVPSNVTIAGIYPYFYGISNTLPSISNIISAISGGTASSTLLDASGTLNITFNATNQFLWFAHFTNNTTKTKWFVDSLNGGNISSPTDLFSTPTTQNVNSPSGNWTGVSFKIYISNFATTTTAPPNSTAIMQLRNS